MEAHSILRPLPRRLKNRGAPSGMSDSSKARNRTAMTRCLLLPCVLLSTLVGFSPLRGQEEAEAFRRAVEEARRSEEAGRLEEALERIGKAIETDPRQPAGLATRASILAKLGKHAESLDDLDRLVELHPEAAQAWELRGDQNFRAGKFAASVADFDRAIELDPDREPWHWKRGISQYYAGQFAKGRKQFEDYQSVQPRDVENAVFCFLCTARQEDLSTARAGFFEIVGDRRVPMDEIWKLYAGKADVDDVLRAVQAGEPDEAQLARREFYAHLYLGLWFDLQDEREKALGWLEKAAVDHLAHGYMGDVARVHRDLLHRQLTAREKTQFELIQFDRRELSSEFYAEGATHADLDGDGHQDIIAGPWLWFGPDLSVRRAYYEPRTYDTKGYSNNFFAFAHDFSRDGKLDILIVGFPGKDASWFENPGEGLKAADAPHWKRHIVFDSVDNESPDWTDLDGDGLPELVCQTGGRFGYASPDWDAPERPWKFTPISADLGLGKFTHGLGVGDLNGDGRDDILWHRGWFEQPAAGADRGLWKAHEFGFAPGRGGAQMLVEDFDGDGDGDVITSLNAHGYGLVWYESRPGEDGSIDFVEHPIMGSRADPNGSSRYGTRFGGLHALALIDVDSDGRRDLVTGTRYLAHGGADAADRESGLFWFQSVQREDGSVEFIPRLIHERSGVGTQVVCGDANGDSLVDVVVANKLGIFVLTQRRQTVDRATWQASRPRAIAKEGLAPPEAAANMRVPAGFEVALAAGEPDLQQPVAFTIDERGRIWVVEAHSYPQRQPEGEGRDRILIFEDRDGDAYCETRKVFASGLNLVSGIEVGFGGVFVGAAPHLLFIADHDRDDRPDGEPEILLDGFGYQDTHETLNTFTWGPDGWLYGCHGVFCNSRVGKPGTPDAARQPINGGVWRFHPSLREFEVFAWGTSNPWGLAFDERGQAFITACVIPHLWHVIQGARYQRQAGQHFNPHVYEDIRTIADHLHHGGKLWTPDHNRLADKLGGGHAHCGAMLYLGDQFPEEWRGRLFFNNIHGNRVNIDRLERRGSGFVGHHGDDFLVANDEWFRGINLRDAPDGSVYLIDWYDAQACHRTQPEIWDRSNGRLYRISFGPPERLETDVGALTSAELVALHTGSSEWHVRTARRILQERGPDPRVHLQLRELLESEEDTPKRLRALWTLHATDGLDESLELALLDDADETVRAWTVQLALEDRAASEELLARLAVAARKDTSQVLRLYLASALSRLQLDARWDIAEGLLSHAEDAGDHNLPLLVWYGVEPLVAAAPARALALARAGRLEKVERFAVRRAAALTEDLEPLVAALGQLDSDDVRRLWLDEVTRAFRGQARLPMPASWESVGELLSKSGDAEVRERTRELALKFGDRRIFPGLRRVLADGNASLERRRRVLSVLLDAQDPELAPLLERLLDDESLRRDAIRALASYDSPRTAPALLERYEQFDREAKADTLATLSARVSTARQLLVAVGAGEVPTKDLGAFTVRQLEQLGDAEVSRAVAEVWGSVRETSADKRAEIERLRRQLTPADLTLADLPNGRSIFDRTCATCHALFGNGKNVGPDLTGSNRANLEYVLENVVDPSAVVGKEYRLNVLVLKNGRVLSGLVTRRTERTVEIQTLNEELIVAASDIVSETLEEKSMMPEGLLSPMGEAGLGKKEVRDLVAYLGSPIQVLRRGVPIAIDPETHAAPGVVEGEALEVLAVSKGNARAQDMTGFSGDRWSGKSQLWWTDGEPGSVLTLRFVVETEGEYQVDLAMTRANDYAVVRFILDGRDVEAPVDLYNETVVPTGPVSLGTHKLDAGDHRLEVEVVGANPAAARKYMFGLDYLHLTRPR